MRLKRPWSRGVAIGGVVAAGIVCTIAGPSPRAQSVEGEEALHPQQHFAIDRPGQLGKADATTIYKTIDELMARRYTISGDRTAAKYLSWPRYNDAPYLSATHGSRYVNNYANNIADAAGYGHLGPGTTMPPGAVLAKDSFTFTSDHELFPGALFVMEKLEPGASPATADWRYLMILPDGSVFGDSTDDPSGLMTFCHDCHAEVADQDYLFFVPEEYRLTPAAK